MDIKKPTGGLGIKNVSPLIFNLFKTATAALIAEIVPFRILSTLIRHRLFFPSLLFWSYHIGQGTHTL